MLKRLTFVHWTRPELQAGKIQILALRTGLVCAVMVTLFFGVILGLWVTLSPHPQYHLSGVLSVCMLVGAVLGGGMSGFYARWQGLLHGGTVGLIYGVLFLIVTAGIAGGDIGVLFTTPMLLRVPLLTLAGALGGIVGVNLPYGRVQAVRRIGR